MTRFNSCYVYFDVNETLLTDYIIGLYTTDGENNLYYHDAELANGAKDKGYRYSGANPNNYVCFQTNDDVCQKIIYIKLLDYIIILKKLNIM